MQNHLPITAMILVTMFSTAACRPRTETPPPAAPVTSVSATVPAPAPTPASVPVPPTIADAAFFDAALNGQMGTVTAALQRGVDANARNPDGRTALMLAAFNGHHLVVASLLSAGARVDDRDPVDRTALMFASSGPDVATVELLLACKADVNAVDSHERWSPLMFAATEGHLPVLRSLLKHGADPTATDDDGDTPVSFARKAGHTAVVALLTAPAPTR